LLKGEVSNPPRPLYKGGIRRRDFIKGGNQGEDFIKGGIRYRGTCGYWIAILRKWNIVSPFLINTHYF